MVRCEMCGSTTSSPKTVKVEGAELQVCSECADFGTEVRTEESTSETSTKYSTGSAGAGTSSGDSGGGGGTSTGTSGGGGRSRDMFDDLDEVAADYDDRIRDAREDAGLSQAELADELNEKASLIRKLERGETLPSDDVQSELEGFLGVELSAGGGASADEEWDGGSSSGEYTLGDVVKRKD